MNIHLSSTRPDGFSHEQRLDAARSLASLVVERHGDAIAAVVVAGSAAVDLDGPYSDLDMTVVTHAGLSDQTKCYTWRGLTINLDYQTIDESLEEARQPYEGGCWRDVLSLYDSNQTVQRLAEESRRVSIDACREAFATAMGDSLVTYVGKVRNSAISGDRQQLIEAAIKFGEDCCVALLGLNDNQAVTGSTRILAATKRLPLLPDRFAELIDIVRAAVPSTEQQLYDAVESLWLGLHRLAAQHGISWETQELQV